MALVGADGNRRAGLTVAALDAPQVLALRVTMSFPTGMPLAPDEPKLDAYLDGSWVFALEALDEQTTRLIERVRADYQPRLRLAPLVYLLVESVFFVMERKMLLGVKQRTEQARSRERLFPLAAVETVHIQYCSSRRVARARL